MGSSPHPVAVEAFLPEDDAPSGGVPPLPTRRPSPAAPAAPKQIPMPTPRRILARLLRVWFLAVSVFGYGSLVTYGWLTWLQNEEQWHWTYVMYFTEVPILGGLCVIALPWWWYRPIHTVLTEWASGRSVSRSQYAMVYERALRLPWWVALSAFFVTCVGYLIGTSVIHWQAEQPLVEVLKALPAIPLVGGMTGAFCYFGTTRALHPVVTWCSVQLRHARSMRHVSLAAKFLTTTCVLAVSMLCLLQPAAYTLGQVITERHLGDRALAALRGLAEHAGALEPLHDRDRLLRAAAVGAHGYVITADPAGRLLTPHPRGYTTLDQEGFYRLAQHLEGREGTWVDRVREHRVVAFVRLERPPWTLLSVAFPSDFALPMRRFFEFSLIVGFEVLFVVVLFGRYYTRGITTPLAELTQAVRRIADHEDFAQHVPVTTNDELSEVARSFNRMVEELQESKTELEDYTKRLERSAQELSALNQEMEDLLRVVSHDLRAPLINIQGFSQRLELVMREVMAALDRLAARSRDAELRREVDALKSSVESRFAESLHFVSKGVEKIDTLLSSLLAVSRIGRKADPLRLNDLNGVLDDVLATFDHQLKERAIQVIRHPLSTRVPCRRNEINQVFSNLVSNAINYMGPSEQRFIEIGGTVRDDHLECFVRDTGIGIRPEDHERIFQMFTRLQAVDAPGEGVGLAYVRKILRSHGGKIWVVSQRGQGSSFHFTLPNEPPPRSASGRMRSAKG